MGTETFLRFPALQERKNALVKLNNPQMGTETSFLPPCKRCFRDMHEVKLNNPLMGTVIYLKNSYKDKNIASIFFLVNMLAFLYKY